MNFFVHSKTLWILFSVIFFGLLSGCSGKKEDMSADIKTENAVIKKDKCTTTFNEGGILTQSLLNPYKTQKALFDKEYNGHAVVTILELSSAETIRFIEEYLQAGVYRSNDEVSDQAYHCMDGDLGHFSSLSESPVIGYWNELVDEGTTLNGLYVQKNDEDNPTQQAVITLNLGAGRGTLVHEMLHHLFEQHRTKIKNLESSKQLWKSYQVQAQKMNEQWDLVKRDKGDLDGALEDTDRFLRLQVEVSIEYALEEIAIERILFDKIIAGELKNIEQGRPRHSIWYTKNSAEKEIIKYEKLDTYFHDLLEKFAEKLNHQQKEKLKQIRAKSKKIQDDIQVHHNWARDQEQIHGKLIPGSGHIGCHHREPVDFSSLLKKIKAE